MMPDPKAQLENRPYPYECAVDDSIEAGRFLLADMMKIARGEVSYRRVKQFARESVTAAQMIACNGTQLVIK